MAHSVSKGFPFIYPSPTSLVGQPLVRGGHCVGLVQEYVAHLGHTSTWRQGERVVETRNLQPGTVIANFEKGKWPGKPHGNHACFFLQCGSRNITGVATSILVVEQFVAANVKAIQARWLRSQGHWKSGEWIDPSNNCDAFFVVLG